MSGEALAKAEALAPVLRSSLLRRMERRIHAAQNKGGSMAQKIDLDTINDKIQLMKKTAQELNQIEKNFPAIARNTIRILASVKMLEINVSDLVELDL